MTNEEGLSNRTSDHSDNSDSSIDGNSKSQEKSFHTAQNHQDGELTAAAALTSLVGGSPSKEVEFEDDDSDDEGDIIDEDGDFTIPIRFTKSGRKRAVSFPLKLMKVLSNKSYSEIITWMPSGKSFMILNSKGFVAQILPSFFKSAKFSSFTRKLHRWGFMKHYRGDEAGAFYHKNFQKGRLDMVEKMTCYKQDGPKVSVPVAARKPERVTPENRGPIAPRPPTTKLPPPAQQQQVPITSHPQFLPQRGVQQRPAMSHQHPPPEPPMDLNAAIEKEVQRRLKERMNSVAWSPHPLYAAHGQPVLASPATAATQAPSYVTWSHSGPHYMTPGPVVSQVMGPGTVAIPFPGGPGLVKYEQVPVHVPGYYCAAPIQPYGGTIAPSSFKAPSNG